MLTYLSILCFNLRKIITGVFATPNCSYVIINHIRNFLFSHFVNDCVLKKPNNWLTDMLILYYSLFTKKAIKSILSWGYECDPMLKLLLALSHVY